MTYCFHSISHENDLILKTEYEDRVATGLSVFDVPIHNVGEYMAAYLAQFRQILSAYAGVLNGRWSFVPLTGSPTVGM